MVPVTGEAKTARRAVVDSVIAATTYCNCKCNYNTLGFEAHGQGNKANACEELLTVYRPILSWLVATHSYLLWSYFVSADTTNDTKHKVIC